MTRVMRPSSRVPLARLLAPRLAAGHPRLTRRQASGSSPGRPIGHVDCQRRSELSLDRAV